MHAPDLTLFIMVRDEAENLRRLLPLCLHEIAKLNIAAELLVVDGNSQDDSVQVAEQHGARVIHQVESGYGAGFREGFLEARGKYVITLDGDFSHPPELIPLLWQNRDRSAIVVGSRYVSGGSSAAPPMRRLLSRILNAVFRSALAISIRDLSSGYRIYRRACVHAEQCTAKRFDMLIEVVIKTMAAGYSVAEIPFNYHPRKHGASHAQLVSFGAAYLSQLIRLWRLRNSIAFADYDHRAFDSRIPLQRYWQRKRHNLVLSFLGDIREEILDVGCGSSRIIQDLPNAVAVDISKRKLRFLRSSNRHRVCASTSKLPFKDEAFRVLIHSQVIEHIPFTPDLFTEMRRVLKPGGLLIIGTPDYGRIWWPVIEFFYDKILPDAYAQEHITHYTRQSLTQTLERHGFTVEAAAYICGGELIMRARAGRGASRHRRLDQPTLLESDDSEESK